MPDKKIGPKQQRLRELAKEKRASGKTKLTGKLEAAKSKLRGKIKEAIVDPVSGIKVKKIGRRGK